MKRFLSNIILAGLFMNFGYPEVQYQYNKWRFKDSLMAEIKNMDVNDFMSISSKYLEEIHPEYEKPTTTNSSKSTSKSEKIKKYQPVSVSPSTMDISSARKAVLKESQRHIGLPYSYGSMDPSSGFDCSGFVGYVYDKSISVKLPRSSRSQFAADGGIFLEYKDLQPGDLMFFSHNGQNIQHVGIYVEEGKFIHAPRTGRRITIDEYSKYWRQHFVKGKSYLQ
jgi:murein DD-endopeptidase